MIEGYDSFYNLENFEMLNCMMSKHLAHFLALILFVALVEPVIAEPEVYGPEPTLADVAYGPHAKHVLDFWKAESDKPTAVAIYIHGGAWRGRDKIDARVWLDIQSMLDAKISVFTIGYRFLDDAPEVKPFVKAPMEDCKLALQFIRSKAKEWNLDKERVGLTGYSAGACTALWLAYHDEMADPNNDDPIFRESTRVSCVVVGGAQTTLDPKQVSEVMPNNKYGGHAFNFSFRKEGFDEMLKERESILPWIKEYSPYELASKDDPPTYLYYDGKWLMPDDRETFSSVHSVAYGMILVKRLKELGVKYEMPEKPKKGPKPFTMLSDPLIQYLSK